MIILLKYLFQSFQISLVNLIIETNKNDLQKFMKKARQSQEQIDELNKALDFHILEIGKMATEKTDLQEQIDELGTLCRNIDDNAYNTWKQITNYQEEDDK